jgi:hypothetical protein
VPHPVLKFALVMIVSSGVVIAAVAIFEWYRRR